MKSLAVTAYAYATSAPGKPGLADPMLTRRMSYLQKATLDCFAKIQPAIDAVNHADKRLLIACATRFGEVDATLTVADAILNRTLPVSPTAFQHSVHNAAAGYVSIVSGRRDPSLTTANGFLSLDLLMYWVAHELDATLIDQVLLFSTSEYATTDSEARGECEALLLERYEDARSGPIAILQNVRYAGDPETTLRFQGDLDDRIRCDAREDMFGTTPTLLRLDHAPRGGFHRLVTNSSEESVLSSWLVPP